MAASGSGKAPVRSRMLPAAKVEDTKAFAEAGSKMRRWMFNTVEELAQDRDAPAEAQFDRKALKTWGWAEEKFQLTPEEVQLYAEVLNGLVGIFYNAVASEGVRKEEAIKLTRDVLVGWILHQNQPYQIAGHGEQQPTYGKYVTIHCPAYRLIIIKEAMSPKCASMGALSSQFKYPPAPELLPELQHLSDLLFMQYALVAGKPPLAEAKAFATPKWILTRAMSQPPEAMQLISYCVKTYTKQNHIPAWPGVTFPIGTYCFNALMGLGIAKAIGHMLITHKKRFAVSKRTAFLLTIDSITVFKFPGDEDPDSHMEKPSLLFHINQVKNVIIRPEGTVDAIYNTHVNAGLEAPGSGIGKSPPHPMTPLKEGKLPGPSWGDFQSNRGSPSGESSESEVDLHESDWNKEHQPQHSVLAPNKKDWNLNVRP